MNPPRPVVAVLGYHKVGTPSPPAWETWYSIPEAVFVDQLRLVLEMGWEPIGVERLLAGLADPAAFPDRGVLITFDDGFRCVLDVALPHMERLGFPGVMFVPTAYVGGTNEFDRETSQPQEPICDRDGLLALEHGGVSVQSHSVTHAAFSTLSPMDIDRELRDSKAALDEMLERPVELFAFPYGDDGTEDTPVGPLLREAGYRAAFRYGGGPFRSPPDSAYRLPRIAMGAETDLARELESVEVA